MKIFDYSKALKIKNASKLVFNKRTNSIIIPQPPISNGCPNVLLASYGNQKPSDGKSYTLKDRVATPVCMLEGSFKTSKSIPCDGVNVYLGSDDNKVLISSIPAPSTPTGDFYVYTFDYPIFDFNTTHVYSMAAFSSTNEGNLTLRPMAVKNSKPEPEPEFDWTVKTFEDSKIYAMSEIADVKIIIYDSKQIGSNEFKISIVSPMMGTSETWLFKNDDGTYHDMSGFTYTISDDSIIQTITYSEDETYSYTFLLTPEKYTESNLYFIDVIFENDLIEPYDPGIEYEKISDKTYRFKYTYNTSRFSLSEFANDPTYSEESNYATYFLLNQTYTIDKIYKNPNLSDIPELNIYANNSNLTHIDDETPIKLARSSLYDAFRENPLLENLPNLSQYHVGNNYIVLYKTCNLKTDILKIYNDIKNVPLDTDHIPRPFNQCGYFINEYCSYQFPTYIVNSEYMKNQLVQIPTDFGGLAGIQEDQIGVMPSTLNYQLSINTIDDYGIYLNSDNYTFKPIFLVYLDGVRYLNFTPNFDVSSDKYCYLNNRTIITSHSTIKIEMYSPFSKTIVASTDTLNISDFI